MGRQKQIFTNQDFHSCVFWNVARQVFGVNAQLSRMKAKDLVTALQATIAKVYSDNGTDYYFVGPIPAYIYNSIPKSVPNIFVITNKNSHLPPVHQNVFITDDIPGKLVELGHCPVDANTASLVEKYNNGGLSTHAAIFRKYWADGMCEKLSMVDQPLNQEDLTANHNIEFLRKKELATAELWVSIQKIADRNVAVVVNMASRDEAFVKMLATCSVPVPPSRVMSVTISPDGLVLMHSSDPATSKLYHYLVCRQFGKYFTNGLFIRENTIYGMFTSVDFVNSFMTFATFHKCTIMTIQAEAQKAPVKQWNLSGTS
jgi:hypothetical protein